MLQIVAFMLTFVDIDDIDVALNDGTYLPVLMAWMFELEELGASLLVVALWLY